WEAGSSSRHFSSMDTISRENNSMLPAGALIVSVIALLLGGYAAITVSKTKNSMKEQVARIDQVDGLTTRVDSVTNQAAKTERFVQEQYRQTKEAFELIGPAITTLQKQVGKLEDVAK